METLAQSFDFIIYFISQVIDFTMHINQHLSTLVANYGMLVYGLIALIIFCEVGLVVAPFLPGDSMLFAIGALCATGAMDLHIVLTLFPVAAILGDNFNRLMGIWFGHKAFSGKDGRFFNKKNLNKAHDFYEKYGPKAVTLCRFMPFLRTFVPFVAGMAEMRWRLFFPYSVLGGTGWVFVCVFAGYFFGNIEIIKQHFELVILTIVTASTMPVVFEYFRARRTGKVSQEESPLANNINDK
jgi:membrane-associated protein